MSRWDDLGINAAGADAVEAVREKARHPAGMQMVTRALYGDPVGTYGALLGERWADGLLTLPAHMIDHVSGYVLVGQPPGDFLWAVLCNDLMEAAGRADASNQRALFLYAAFLHNHAPSECFRSRARVVTWCRKGGVIGGPFARPEGDFDAS